MHECTYIVLYVYWDIRIYVPSAETGEWLVATMFTVTFSLTPIAPWVINKVTGTPFNDSDPMKLDELNSTSVSEIKHIEICTYK